MGLYVDLRIQQYLLTRVIVRSKRSVCLIAERAVANRSVQFTVMKRSSRGADYFDLVRQYRFMGMFEPLEQVSGVTAVKGSCRRISG